MKHCIYTSTGCAYNMAQVSRGRAADFSPAPTLHQAIAPDGDVFVPSDTTVNAQTARILDEISAGKTRQQAAKDLVRVVRRIEEQLVESQNRSEQ